MPYTPPHTFVSGDPLQATDLNANLDALQTYVNTGVVAADVVTASIETGGILRPTITPISDNVISVYLQQGSIHQLRHPCLDYDPRAGEIKNAPYSNTGFVTNTLHSDDGGTAAYEPLPKSFISFYCHQASAVVVRVNMSLVVPDDSLAVTPRNKVYIRLVNAAGTVSNALESMCRVGRAESAANQGSTDMRPIQTCAIFTSVAVGWHHVGIAVGLNNNYGLIGGYEMIVEAFHTGV